MTSFYIDVDISNGAGKDLILTKLQWIRQQKQINRTVHDSLDVAWQTFCNSMAMRLRLSCYWPTTEKLVKRV